VAKVGREICRGSALYQSLSDTSKGRLCYDLTIAFRDVATALTVTQSDLEKLQGINEIQHKALSQMLAHQSGRAERYADREFFLLLLDMSKNYKVSGYLQYSLMKALEAGRHTSSA
jgi:DNA-binding FadR family transcriptional regulator